MTRAEYIVGNVRLALSLILGLVGTGWLFVWIDGACGFPVSFLLGGLGFLLWTGLLLLSVLFPRRLHVELQKLHRQGSLQLAFLFLPVAYCLYFAFLVRGIYNVFGPGHFASLPPVVSDWTWVFYLLDNIVRALIFDVAEIYGLSVSEVDHRQSDIWMSTIIFCFRTTLALALLRLVVDALRKERSPSAVEKVASTGPHDRNRNGPAALQPLATANSNRCPGCDSTLGKRIDFCPSCGRIIWSEMGQAIGGAVVFIGSGTAIIVMTDTAWKWLGTGLATVGLVTLVGLVSLTLRALGIRRKRSS